MNAVELRVMVSALSFLAVASREKSETAGHAERVHALSKLVYDYCRWAEPDAYPQECAPMNDLVREMISALELCLESGGLSWEAEQEAELVCNKARQMLCFPLDRHAMDRRQSTSGAASTD